jgi:anti-sigma factor RsiW
MLPDLLDRSLPPAREAAVRAHAERCGRCRRRLAELELCDRLVARLPLGVIPLTAGDERLAGLARWAFVRAPRRRVGLEGLAVTAAAAALAGIVTLAGTARWTPGPEDAAPSVIQVAYVMPGAVRPR